MKRIMPKKQVTNWSAGGQAKILGQKQPAPGAVKKYLEWIKKNSIGKRKPLE